MNERKPTFPAKVGGHDDDLTVVQREKLEAGGSEPTTVIGAATAGTIGVVSLRTWECLKHKIVVIQGDPCPECGVRQLLD